MPGSSLDIEIHKNFNQSEFEALFQEFKTIHKLQPESFCEEKGVQVKLMIRWKGLLGRSSLPSWNRKVLRCLVFTQFYNQTQNPIHHTESQELTHFAATILPNIDSNRNQSHFYYSSNNFLVISKNKKKK
ncbi:hypothetical protein LWI29_035384 [Acer saccharum]|uniref:Uncharacterized protein n=1 Tax=Acer saccharum TaxID=4024 RepID=A0AA39RP85_ACESA|nr:hypothetical protein LWI29_035384 [Acer saccharum]